MPKKVDIKSDTDIGIVCETMAWRGSNILALLIFRGYIPVKFSEMFARVGPEGTRSFLLPENTIELFTGFMDW